MIYCLSNPTEHVRTQVIVLQSSHSEYLVPLLDQLGALYDIDPFFYEIALFGVSERAAGISRTSYRMYPERHPLE